VSKTPEKKRARALQEQTGWHYTECLSLVRTKTEEQIDALVETRPRGEHFTAAMLERAIAPRPDRADPTAYGYPAGWPECPGCGKPALDGHITCGDLRCGEAARRG
jgi:hypothetical protein